MAASLNLVFADDTLVLGHIGAVMVTVIRANLGIEHYRAVHRLSRELVQRYDGRIGSLLTVRSRLMDLPRVDDEQRRLAREIMTMGGARTIGAVAAIEGGGFWSAGVRSILVGICLIARPPFPWRIVDATAEGARWLRERWPAGTEAPSEHELTDAVRAMVAIAAYPTRAAS